MLFHSHVAVGIPLGIVILLEREIMCLLFVDVAPNFIGLNVLDRHVDYQSRHDLFAALPGENQGLGDRVLVQAGNPHGGANRVAFQQELESDDHFVLRQVHFAKGEAMGFGVGPVALRAAKPAQAVAVRSEALTSHVAILTSRCNLGLYLSVHDSIIHRTLGVVNIPVGCICE